MHVRDPCMTHAMMESRLVPHVRLRHALCIEAQACPIVVKHDTYDAPRCSLALGPRDGPRDGPHDGPHDGPRDGPRDGPCPLL